MQYRNLITIVAVLLTLGVVVNSPASAGVAIDNTANGTSPLSTGGTAFGNALFQAKVFTTPASTTSQITSVVLGLSNSSGGSTVILTNLFRVDASNNPTGTSLGQTTSSFLALTSTPAYYTIDLSSGIVGQTVLAANTSYALVFSGATTVGTTIWDDPVGNTGYSTANGFSFVGTRRSTNPSTLTWVADSNNNALQINSNLPVVVIPEPATGVLLLTSMGGALLLGGILKRRPI